MVLGFFKHVYQYFVPRVQNKDELEISRDGGALLSDPFLAGAVPMYDTTGRIIGYIQDKPPVSELRIPKNIPLPGPTRFESTSKFVIGNTNEIIYTRTPEGHFIPIQNPEEKQGRAHKEDSGAEVHWDGWPDGKFERDFTLDEVNETNDLAIHWAHTVGGGDRKGQRFAEEWTSGKRATRTCLGILQCDNQDCEITVRPHTKPQSLRTQLLKPCSCGAMLYHLKCDVKSILWTWSKGIHYQNSGYHVHRRPPRKLHLLPEEKRRFEAMVNAHPQVGPLQLIVGVPGIDGPGESVADISDVLLNADRVTKERQKLKRPADTGGDHFIRAFAKFEQEHPGFIILSTIGKVTVISVQTPFMQSQMVKDEVLDGPVNGMVSDAAHGWWKERTSRGEHFMYHFLAVFQTIAHEAQKRHLEVEDRLFAGVMDFSQAERLGFITAFVEFWYRRPDSNRSREELQDAAEKLLRGCAEHFRAGVTRVSRITGAVPPEKAEDFVKRAMSLLHAADTDEFCSRLALLARDFPKLMDWFNWWSRPSHAMMLFGSERKMDADLWDAIPATTNAEEAMHWKLYRACGRDHAFLEGLASLYQIAIYYERQYSSVKKGVPLWNFPAELAPHTPFAAKHDGIIYDLVGLALVNRAGSHFIARYASEDRTTVFTYDDMKHGGRPTKEVGAKVSTHLAGQDPQLPKGFRAYQAYYRLRGGLVAQKKFYDLRTAAFQQEYCLGFSEPSFGKRFSVSYTADDMVPMDKKTRFWLRNASSRPTMEYLSKILDPMLSLDLESDVAESEEETYQLKPDTKSGTLGLKSSRHLTSDLSSPPPSLRGPAHTPPHTSARSSTSSAPDSLFALDCRCGSVGNGNLLYRREEGQAVQCDECRNWSHIACQKEGRASRLGEHEPFLTSERKKIEQETRMKLPLKERLKEGCGALARHGKFWYPVRLIQSEKMQSRWLVRWWRGCEFEESGITPDFYTLVPAIDLVDSLWMDRTERRKIRLGKWTHACEVETPEDILANPDSIPYTKEVDDALTPAKAVLADLLKKPDGVPSAGVPAKEWIKAQKKSLARALVPYVGSLSIIERAQVANWFEVHVSTDKKIRHKWLGLLPIAHAYTVFISSRLKAEPKHRHLADNIILEKAWKIQFTGLPSLWTDVDVDKECLERLEEKMFERSMRAGIAGHYQWGLDAGDHQNDWDPYRGTPGHWNLGDRDGSEGEMERGPSFILQKGIWREYKNKESRSVAENKASNQEAGYKRARKDPNILRDLATIGEREFRLWKLDGTIPPVHWDVHAL
ncbi:hypothetical protein D9615_006638 [Tricholomella constricta]|uniref:Uncharacterized protein n=1 Tax=Tricholomella constricta TaxID=117010 RepID=A0A8H5HA35_9AGAR|nr:hypothetical protein D9615_006638 [Tricholomella constricta]